MTGGAQVSGFTGRPHESFQMFSGERYHRFVTEGERAKLDYPAAWMERALVIAPNETVGLERAYKAKRRTRRQVGCPGCVGERERRVVADRDQQGDRAVDRPSAGACHPMPPWSPVGGRHIKSTENIAVRRNTSAT